MERSEDGRMIVIRLAVPDRDAAALQRIYAHYVKKTAVSFDYVAPSVQAFREGMEDTLARYPYLVADCGGEPVGYAYAAPFKARAAYDWAVETTIYVRPDQKRRGIGRRLYGALEHMLAEQGILNMNACIAWTDQEDRYLVNDSVRYHERMGFDMVGRFHQCGHKFGRWYDMVWMEKLIGRHSESQPPIKPFSALPKSGIIC